MNIFVKKPDIVGMLASGLCALHCAAFPLLFVASPLVHGASHDEAGHHGHDHGHGLWGSLDAVFLVLSLFAVYYASRASRQASTRVWLWVGWILFAGGLLMEHLGMVGWLMYVGSGVLLVTHLINFRQCQAPSRSGL